MKLGRMVAAVAMAAVSGGSTQLAQVPEPCPRCGIARTRVVTLGSPSDAVRLGPVSGAVRNSRGHYFARSEDGFRIIEFDTLGRYRKAVQVVESPPTGSPPARPIGSFFVGPGDSLYVKLDTSMLVYSPSLDHVRTFFVPRGMNGLQYELELWSRAGELRRTLPVRSGWFEPTDAGAPPRRGSPPPGQHPPPGLSQLALDPQDRFWIGGHKPVDNWQPVPNQRFIAGYAVVSTSEIDVLQAITRNTVTVVDVVNVRGEVLASQQFPGEAVYLMEPGLAFTRSYGANGAVSLVVWQLSITRPPAGR